MRILALDLSLNGSGIAVLENEGDKVAVLYTELVDNKRCKLEGAKLQNIESALVKVLNEYGAHAVVREKGFSRFAGTTQKLFKVVGVSDLTTYKHGFAVVHEFPPTTVKKCLTGSGKAEKQEVQDAVREYLTKDCRDMKFESDDVSDAVAVGITYMLTNGIELKKGE